MLMDQAINPLLIEELFMSPLCVEFNYAQALAASAYMAYSTKKPLNSSRHVSSYCINPESKLQVETGTPGSVGIVVIDGPIVSNSDSWYGIKGTYEASQELLAFEADPNIIGTVLYLETGGGAAYAIKPIGDVLSSCTKPVVTYSKQILASAGYRIAANTDYIMMYHPQGIVGSLGTMISMSDMQPMFEKWGITFFEYYASESILKNKTFRDAKQGDGKAIVSRMLDPMNDVFLSDIKALRGNKISSTEKSVYQGETYLASTEGIKFGLIDSLGSLADAVAVVVSIANGETPSSINSTFIKSNTTMFNGLFDQKLPALFALSKIKAEEVTAEHVQAINKEIVAANIPGVTLALDSDIAAAATAASDNAAALSAINAILGTADAKSNLPDALAAFTTATSKTAATLQEVTTERDGWKAKAVEYGAKDADKPTETKKEGDDKIDNTATDVSKSTWSQADADLAKMRADHGIKPKKKA